MTQFSDLGLDEALLKAVAAEGYTTPTPIQAQAIRPILEGRDLLGIAQTGTGKTAAFALPILHRLAASRKPAMRRGVRCLVLAPTRELATQIADSFKTYGRHLGFSVITVFGGVGHRPQATALQRGVDVVVATPGRLLDHMGEGNVDLSATEILVLDEADQMMDLGFIKPLRQIISKLSRRRQSLFFSATMPQEIGALAAEMLSEPYRVSVTPVAKTADRVAQQVIYIEQKKKRSLLVELFADASMSRTLIFTRTKRGADRVARHLDAAGIKVAAIHGNKSQNQREAALGAFKANKLRALVATDIAARGIDIDEVSHVVNFEMPNIPESYVHRIGRTARAGAEGIAISLVDNEERVYLRDIEKLTRQQIPFTDRRNDTTLAVEERSASRGEGDDERGDRRQTHGRGQARGPGGHRGGQGGQDGRGQRSGTARDGAQRANPGHDGGHRDAGARQGDRNGPRGGERHGSARPEGQRSGGGQRRSNLRDGGPSHGDDRRGEGAQAVWSNHGGGLDRDFRSSRNPSPQALGDVAGQGERRPSEPRQHDRREHREHRDGGRGHHASGNGQRGHGGPRGGQERGSHERGARHSGAARGGHRDARQGDRRG